MKAKILVFSFGVLALSEENKLIKKVLFHKEPRAAAETLTKINTGQIVDEVAELVRKLKKSGYHTFLFDLPNVARAIEENFGVEVEVSKSFQPRNLDFHVKYAVETGFVKDAEEFNLWTHNLTLEIAKLKVKEATANRDLLVIQAVQTLDDLDKTINLFMGRVREWYGIHFPELDRLLEKHEVYARLVCHLGSKENFIVKNLVKEEIPASKAKQIAEASRKSMGPELTITDLKHIQELCSSVLNLYQLRQTIHRYIDNAMVEIAPNMKAIAGSLLGARLIALVGSLMNLAKKPASTIQVLGAERALFRSLKTGARPPKHGVIFHHPFLHEANRRHRGKIARALAGKIAIAARIDAFGGKYIGEKLENTLEKRIEAIRHSGTSPKRDNKG